MGILAELIKERGIENISGDRRALLLQCLIKESKDLLDMNPQHNKTDPDTGVTY
jgi:hypothetical protein